MADAQAEPEVQTGHVEYDSVVHVRNLSKRELDVRLVPWGATAETPDGLESFERGAFDDAIPSEVLLYGVEHEAQLGIGQSGQPVMNRVPTGRALALDSRDDGQYATFRVARTARGDDLLALAEDGLVTGVSVEFETLPGGTRHTRSGARRRVIHTRARLRGASTTHRPAYAGAEVLAVRNKESQVAEPTVQEAPAAAPAVDITAISQAVGQAVGSEIKGLKDSLDQAVTDVQARSASDEAMAQVLAKIEALEEQARSNFSIPASTQSSHPDFGRGDWLKLVLRSMTGEAVSRQEIQARITADLVTADNLGVVPTAFLPEMIGIIDKGRPFLESTRRLRTPASGMTFTVPKIVTRPTTGIQAAEKDELTSTASSITTQNFDPTTIGGYGDISLQLLKRSDPSFLELYTDMLGEAYAIDADDKAIDVLIAAGMSQGGAFDPDDGPKFGEAWANAVAVSRLLRPDTIWMSTAAVQQFIDAVNPTTGAPLYGRLVANFSAASGVGGDVSGLRPVHVPALDDETADIIVGPSSAFVWAEDGTYTLQVDVPAKAGRDVGLVGMIWCGALYPTAFTRYWLESS